MKGYVALSVGAHGAFLASLITLGSLLAKPHMGYYSVDLISLPSGKPGGGGEAPAISTPPQEIVKPEDIQRAAPQTKAPTKEAIRIQGKVKKKAPPRPVQTTKPSSKPKRSAAFEEAMRALGQGDAHSSGSGSSGAVGLSGNNGAGGSGLVADGGNTFPYPWYLKSVSNRLDKQWHPPQEFASDTVCQVAFIIHRDGQVSDVIIEKPSGDSMFDQLAQRAVVYANPVPPLPSGFPEETLRVHMKFIGKRL